MKTKKIEIYYYTNRGKIRKNNEDCILIDDKIFQDNFSSYSHLELEKEKALFVVADGMGGHAKGEVASYIVLDTLRQSEIQNHKDLIEKLYIAKKKLNEYVKNNPSAYGLGTVVAGVLIQEKEILVFNIGDSRVYLIDEHNVIRISKDHSYVEELVDKGIITYEQARIHPQKNIITSAISGNQTNEISKFFIKKIEKKSNTKFLICSDGLWEMLSSEEIHNCFQVKNLDMTSQKLIEIAMEKGAFDNISFIILNFIE